MALDSVHPLYTDMKPDWTKMRDVYKGERHVKSRGREYLPPTKGMLIDGYGSVTAANTVNLGTEAYEAYKLRAVVPEYVKDAVETLIGLLHSQPPVIELPPQMEYMRESATTQGESLELLLQRINEEQLITGRLGLLLDMPRELTLGLVEPKIALYVTETARNWDDGEVEEGESNLNMVVLDESGFRRNGFEWNFVTKYRVLELPFIAQGEDATKVTFGPYRQGVFESAEGGTPTYVESDMFEPTIRGNKLEQLPFVFINTKDILAAPDQPVLLGVANDCLTIYRGEADYRQTLFAQSQETLVIIGDLKSSKAADPNELQPSRGNVLNSEEPLRTGTGAMIHLEGGENAKAEYIGISAAGLSEMRTALENDRQRAEGKAAPLSADTKDSNASGEALKTRVGSRTASLNQVAKTGAGGLQWLLRLQATWMGADPLKVIITPNLEFADFQLDGATLAAIVAVKQSGAPLSWESVHALMARGNITEMDFKTEKALADAEKEDMIPEGTGAGGNPGDDNEDD